MGIWYIFTPSSKHAHKKTLKKISKKVLLISRHGSIPKPPAEASVYLGNLGEHGLTLSRSRQQGRSTAYKTRTHIKVVCRGFIPARLKLQSARRRRLTSEAAETRPDGAQGQRPILARLRAREHRRVPARILT
jgi:hypothetical protein